MLDALASRSSTRRRRSRALCQAHPIVPLEPAQVLDRLLWFDAWGIRYFPEIVDEDA